AQRALAAAASRREAAAGALEAAWAEWRRAGAEELGLGETVSPEAALDLVRLAETAKPLFGRRDAARGERERLAAAIADFERRVAEAVPAGGDALPGEDAVGKLRRWKAMNEAAAERSRNRERADIACRERQAAFDECAARAEELRRSLDGLLRACGAGSPEELRRLLRLRQERLEERRAIGDLEALLASLIGTDGEAARLAALPPEELGAALQAARDAVGEIEEELKRLRERKGERRQAAEELRRAAEQTDRLQRLEELRGQLLRQAEAWCVHALAAALLREARAAYERDRQPDVLRRASRFFAGLTGERYRGVAESDGALMAVRADGERVEPARLSRGTSEQLYLALRFGLAEHLAEVRGLPLPLVLDDLFVNFDAERTELALRQVGSLAERMQVLLFTCHPHIRDWAKRIMGNRLATVSIGESGRPAG
ncbi:ATP-binding protein, partial [Paenibacillus thermoaerophilus]